MKSKQLNTVVPLVWMVLAGSNGCAVKTADLQTISDGRCRLQTVRIISEEGSNDNTPTAIDIIKISNMALAAMLAKKNAFEWFREKSGISLRYPDDVQIFSAELVPLSDTVLYLPFRSVLRKSVVLLFARYNDPAGRSCMEITKFHNAEVVLSNRKISISERRYW